MKPSWKKVVESVLPPVVTNAYKASRAVRQYRGKYSSWAEAKAASSGYDSPLILEKSVSAMRAVKEGKASYARDGIAFSEPYFPYYLLTMMLRQAALDNGRLSVLDFGGSLGNTYYQCRRLLLGIGNLKWNVVEQETHVRAGNENFSDSQLKFHRTTSECLGDSPNVLLLSSVLQYLEQPFGTLKELLELRPKTVLIDQTPLSLEGEEYLTVQ